MDELVPYYEVIRAKRDTRKQITRVRQRSMINQAALEAATRDAVRRVSSDEHVAYTFAEARIDNGFKLTALTVVNAVGLNHLVNHATRGNPGLEASLREVEDSARMSALLIISRHVTRPYR